MVMDLLGRNTPSKLRDSIAVAQLTHPNNHSIAPWLSEKTLSTLPSLLLSTLTQL